MSRPKRATLDTHVRLPLALHQQLRALAEESQRSIQEEITLRLQLSVDSMRRVGFKLTGEPRVGQEGN